MKKNILESFQTVKEKHNVEKPDVFRYLHLRQHLLQETMKTEINLEPDGIIQLLTQAYTNSPESVISKLYQKMAKGRRTTTIYIKETQENELNHKINIFVHFLLCILVWI